MSELMVNTVENILAEPPSLEASTRASAPCFHCGEPCNGTSHEKDDKSFCCQGCLTVHDLLAASGLGHFYDLERHPGLRIRHQPRHEQWAYLDQPELARKLLDFSDQN